MFRGIKNIASDIRSEVSHTEQKYSHAHTPGHTHSQSQSSAGSSSKTKRFLSSARSSTSSSQTGFSSGRRAKAFEELDGRTETETVVHLALMKFYKEQGKAVPPFLGGSNPMAGERNRPSLDSQSHSKMQQKSQQALQAEAQRPAATGVHPPPPRSLQASRSVRMQHSQSETQKQQYSETFQQQQRHHSPRKTPQPELNSEYPKISKARSEDILSSRRFQASDQNLPAESSPHARQKTSQASPPSLNRLHSRFGGGSINNGVGHGGGSRFGRRVE